MSNINIVDIGIGNIASLCSAFEKLKISYKLCKTLNDFQNNSKIVIPGVGAFGSFMKRLREKEIDKLIINKAKNNVPILGICLGFQILFTKSNEHGYHKGLDLIEGEFNRIDSTMRVPHIGWDDCSLNQKNNLFYNIKNNSDFYFIHSYLLKNYNKKEVISFTNYGLNFPSSINKNKTFGVQFHPEKSQYNGLQIIKNFAERC